MIQTDSNQLDLKEIKQLQRILKQHGFKQIPWIQSDDMMTTYSGFGFSRK